MKLVVVVAVVLWDDDIKRSQDDFYYKIQQFIRRASHLDTLLFWTKYYYLNFTLRVRLDVVNLFRSDVEFGRRLFFFKNKILPFHLRPYVGTSSRTVSHFSLGLLLLLIFLTHASLVGFLVFWCGFHIWEVILLLWYFLPSWTPLSWWTLTQFFNTYIRLRNLPTVPGCCCWQGTAGQAVCAGRTNIS